MAEPLQMDDAENRSSRQLSTAIRFLPLTGAQVAGARFSQRRASAADPLRLYIYRWDRHGRKGQRCRIFARGTMNSVGLEFDDGFRMISSGNALRRA